MASVLSNAQANGWLTQRFTNLSNWLALHSDDPTSVGDPSTELAGGGYQRQPITFSAGSNRAVVSTNAQQFDGLLPGTVRYLAVWASRVGGAMVVTIAISPLNLPASGLILLSAGDIAISL